MMTKGSTIIRSVSLCQRSYDAALALDNFSKFVRDALLDQDAETTRELLRLRTDVLRRFREKTGVEFPEDL